MELQIIVAAALQDPTRLEGLARRVFGEGDRPAGWFARKLRREHVELGLSPLAVRAGGDPNEPEDWLGYVLVGTLPSLGRTARTAGTGVLASARGQGVGTRLLEAAVRRAAEAGLDGLQIQAQAEVASFYVHHGFERRLETVTALAFARSSAPPQLEPPPPWRAVSRDEHEPVAWLPEAWEGTEAGARHGLAWTSARGIPVRAWLSREGVAWLVQRVVTHAGSPEGTAATLPWLADELLARLPAGAPVLLPMLPAQAPATRALLDGGWSAAQRGVLLERRLLYTRAPVVP